MQPLKIPWHTKKELTIISILPLPTHRPPLSPSAPHTTPSALKWHDVAATKDIIDPMTGDVFCKVPDTKPSELGPFEEAAKRALKSGMHNPIKDPQL